MARVLAHEAMCVLMAVLVASPVAAGKLGQVRDAAHGHSDDDDDANDEQSESGDASDEDGQDTTAGDGWGVFLFCISPFGWLFCGPRAIVEEEYEDDGGSAAPERLFYPYPYWDAHRGFLAGPSPAPTPETALADQNEVEVNTVTLDVDVGELRPLSVRLMPGYTYDLSGVHGPALHGTLDSSVRVGLDTTWVFYFEPLSPHETDNMVIGDLNLLYRFAQSRGASFRAGLGGRAMLDDTGNEFGFNFTYLMDFFPVRPWVISLEADLGNLGRAFYTHARGTCGAAILLVEVFAGYDLVALDPGGASVLLHGPTVGLRWWL